MTHRFPNIVRLTISACAFCFICSVATAASVAAQAYPATPSNAHQPVANALAAGSAKLTFRRVFKSSTPEFIEITVRNDSDDATYEIRQLDDDPGASKFEVSAEWRGKMFQLAEQLHHFEGLDLDVHRKIANLGEKTFRWERGGQVHEAKFNYTLNSAASQLLQIFEGLARQQELLTLLERRMKYDKLGINDALLQFEIELNKNLLPEPKRALPTLDQIASDSRFVDIGRQRARTLADRIRHQS